MQHEFLQDQQKNQDVSEELCAQVLIKTDEMVKKSSALREEVDFVCTIFSTIGVKQVPTEVNQEQEA